ncbi:uncharacterized protein LOC109805540 [Cajanus cajan]|uniref:uncharacterized protein LOC109805540 n=1 Tax=Cajanus cajan TaxID=3821 RepID=UPI00098D75D7|nr:uncharacterized protein LOC109805540 [Cajanus cajan]
MHLSIKLKPHFNSTLHSHLHTHQFALEGFPGFSQRRVGTLFMPWHFPQLKNNTLLCLTLHGRRLYSSSSNDSTPELSDANSHEGSSESKENKKGKSLTSNEILKKLRRYGVSGILSYGLLNTAYYLTTFLFVWFYIAPAPAKMGYVAAVQRFLKVMAMVWAGSQVTKLLRAGGALALAPFVDRGLSWFTDKFKFQSQGKAFMAIVGFCLGLALIVFLVITLLWA